MIHRGGTMGTYYFGRTSKENLQTCHRLLDLVLRRSLSLGLIDFSVVEGTRSKGEQNRYFSLGKSKLKWPNSKHNIINPKDKSKAGDVVPYVNSKLSYDVRHCCYLAGIIIATGKSLGIEIRWGGNWDMDGEPITDQDFQDLVHYEVIT